MSILLVFLRSSFVFLFLLLLLLCLPLGIPRPFFWWRCTHTHTHVHSIFEHGHIKCVASIMGNCRGNFAQSQKVYHELSIHEPSHRIMFTCQISMCTFIYVCSGWHDFICMGMEVDTFIVRWINAKPHTNFAVLCTKNGCLCYGSQHSIVSFHRTRMELMGTLFRLV